MKELELRRDYGIGGMRAASRTPRRPGRNLDAGSDAEGGGYGPLSQDPIVFLMAAHDAQLHLCDQLEAIADSLPGNVDPLACRRVAIALGQDVHLHHLDEEEGLFPLMRGHAPNDAALAEMIRRLEAEHASDKGFADELTELLELLARGERPHDQEAAGYMLRGFFESFRRHLSFENDVILPRAAEMLTQAERDVLMDIIRRHRLAAPRPLFRDPEGGASRH